MAVFVGTVVWRVMMPDGPDPRYGAVGGVASAVGSPFVFAASIWLTASPSRVSAGTLGGAVSEFVFLTAVISLLGAIITLPAVSPLGALVGYDYERYVVGG